MPNPKDVKPEPISPQMQQFLDSLPVLTPADFAKMRFDAAVKMPLFTVNRKDAENA